MKDNARTSTRRTRNTTRRALFTKNQGFPTAFRLSMPMASSASREQAHQRVV
jgi:hypothetical protein